MAWDADKARANFEKHGIHFSDAEGVVYDPLAVTCEDPTAEGESRFVSIGLTGSPDPSLLSTLTGRRPCG